MSGTHASIRSCVVWLFAAVLLIGWWNTTVAVPAEDAAAATPVPVDPETVDKNESKKTEPTSQQESIPTDLLGVIQSGGYLMIPIGICSLILVAFVLERAISLRRGRVIPRPFVRRFIKQLREGELDREKALDLCEANGSPVAKVFAGAARKWGRPAVEVEQAIIDTGERVTNGLRRYLRVINGVATVTPLLGLLGIGRRWPDSRLQLVVVGLIVAGNISLLPCSLAVPAANALMLGVLAAAIWFILGAQIRRARVAVGSLLVLWLGCTALPGQALAGGIVGGPATGRVASARSNTGGQPVLLAGGKSARRWLGAKGRRGRWLRNRRLSPGQIRKLLRKRGRSHRGAGSKRPAMRPLKPAWAVHGAIRVRLRSRPVQCQARQEARRVRPLP